MANALLVMTAFAALAASALDAVDAAAELPPLGIAAVDDGDSRRIELIGRVQAVEEVVGKNSDDGDPKRMKLPAHHLRRADRLRGKDGDRRRAKSNAFHLGPLLGSSAPVVDDEDTKRVKSIIGQLSLVVDDTATDASTDMDNMTKSVLNVTPAVDDADRDNSKLVELGTQQPSPFADDAATTDIDDTTKALLTVTAFVALVASVLAVAQSLDDYIQTADDDGDSNRVESIATDDDSRTVTSIGRLMRAVGGGAGTRVDDGGSELRQESIKEEGDLSQII